MHSCNCGGLVYELAPVRGYCHASRHVPHQGSPIPWSQCHNAMNYIGLTDTYGTNNSGHIGYSIWHWGDFPRPWKECSRKDERLRFVARLLDGEKMTVLCREFGISRKTGYKIYNRCKDCGLRVLGGRDRSPCRIPTNCLSRARQPC